MEKSEEYLKNLTGILEKIRTEQLGRIDAAAGVIASSMEKGGRVFAFGTGHSHLLAEEIFYRAGGLAAIHPILESALMLHESASKSTEMERLPEYGKLIFEHYGLKAGDVLLAFSNSGRNGVAIDLALLAASSGVHVIVITDMAHTLSGESRHPSGKKLYETAEIVIDNGGCVGDAAVPIEALGKKVSPTSTAAGSAILGAVMAQAIEKMCDDGFVPDVFSSSNVDGGDEVNRRLVEKYQREIRFL